MTSQQKADEWLAVWQALRALGYSPPARDRIIENVYVEHHRQRLDAIVADLQGATTRHI